MDKEFSKLTPEEGERPAWGYKSWFAWELTGSEARKNEPPSPGTVLGVTPRTDQVVCCVCLTHGFTSRPC